MKVVFSSQQWGAKRVGLPVALLLATLPLARESVASHRIERPIPHAYIAGGQPPPPKSGASASQLLKQIQAMKLQPQDMSLKTARKLTPLIKQITSNLEKGEYLSEKELHDLTFLTFNGLNFPRDSVNKSMKKKGGMSFVMAVLDLQAALINRHKNFEGRLHSEGVQIPVDWVWKLDIYKGTPAAGIKIALAHARYCLADPTLFEYVHLDTWPLLQQYADTLPKMPVPKGIRELELLIDYQVLLRRAKYQHLLPKAAQQQYEDWGIRKLDSMYTNYIKQRLLASENFAEQRLLGKILAHGIYAEGLNKSEVGMSRLGFDILSATSSIPPSMSKADRYGNVGPFTRLFLDIDRVAYIGGRGVFEGFSDPKDWRNDMARYQFNRNAITTYLCTAEALSNYPDTKQFMLLTSRRFKEALAHGFYPKSAGPDPKAWGQHMGLCLTVMQDKSEEREIDEDFFKIKADFVRDCLHGYQPPDRPAVKGLMAEYRRYLQYKLLIEKGIQDPNKEVEKAKKLMADSQFKKELDCRVEAAWKAFEEGLCITMPREKAIEIMKILKSKASNKK